MSLASLPRARAMSWWSALRDVCGSTAGLALSYPLPTLGLVGLAYAFTGISPLRVAITLAVMVLISVGGPSSRARLLSLTDAAKFSYRRWRIRRTARRVYLNAGIYRTEHNPHLGNGSHGPGHRITPKVYRYGRHRIRRSANGLLVTVNGAAAGYGTEAFEGEAAVTMRASWKCREVQVTAHPVYNWLTLIRPIYGDPFAAVISPESLPAASTPWHVVVGMDSDSHPIEKDLRLPILIAGAQGAGKSSECWRILQALVEAGVPFRTRVYDPKGGQEFDVLNGKAHYYESNPTRWCRFLETAIRAMGARQAALKAAVHDDGVGYRDCPIGDSRFPLDVMIIDELVTVIAMMKNEKVDINGQKVPALQAFMVFLSQCRAAGFTVIACSQLTQKEAIGVIRDLFGYVTCLRVGSAEMVRTVLGDPKLYPAHQIPAGRKWAGIGFMGTDAGPRKYRAAYVDDRQRSALAEVIGAMTEQMRQLEAAVAAEIPQPCDGESVGMSDFVAAAEDFAHVPSDSDSEE